MADDDFRKIFSKNLNDYMYKNHKTQTDLINDLHLNKSTVSTWINGIKIPRMNKIELLANYFGITKADLVEEHNDNEQFSSKDELDIAKRLEATLNDLESNEALMFSGEPLDDATKELLRLSLENSLRIAKVNAKEKYTPKKYKNDK